MALDGPHDDDAAADALRGAERGFRPERYTDHREVRGRDEVYEELRVRQELGTSTVDRDDAPERTKDGGWKWKGLELDPAANRIADDGIAARREAEGRDAAGNYREGGITPDMRRIEGELEHGTLVPDTEKFALKSPDRFKEKLAKLVTLEPDTPAANLASQIHDGVRYTFIFDAQNYSDGVKHAEKLLHAGGYELYGRKPSWSGAEYKGINTQWCDARSGLPFEVQFHTPESWEAKQHTHDAYEKVSCPTTPPEERARMRAYQRDVSASVNVPPGALDFLPYKRVEGTE